MLHCSLQSALNVFGFFDRGKKIFRAQIPFLKVFIFALIVTWRLL
jgi:hypothetical protein